MRDNHGVSPKWMSLCHIHGKIIKGLLNARAPYLCDIFTQGERFEERMEGSIVWKTHGSLWVQQLYSFPWFEKWPFRTKFIIQTT